MAHYGYNESIQSDKWYAHIKILFLYLYIPLLYKIIYNLFTLEIVHKNN